MTVTLPTRDEVPTDLTWDLTSVFADDDAWEAEYAAVQKLVPTLKQLQGTLGRAQRNWLRVSPRFWPRSAGWRSCTCTRP